MVLAKGSGVRNRRRTLRDFVYSTKFHLGRMSKFRDLMYSMVTPVNNTALYD